MSHSTVNSHDIGTVIGIPCAIVETARGFTVLGAVCGALLVMPNIIRLMNESLKLLTDLLRVYKGGLDVPSADEVRADAESVIRDAAIVHDQIKSEIRKARDGETPGS